jgi:hypothetical protein
VFPQVLLVLLVLFINNPRESAVLQC